MSSEIRDYLKIALLAVIAVSLTYGTFFKKGKSRRTLKSENSPSAAPASFPQDEDLALKINPEEDKGTVSSFAPTTMAWQSDKHDFGNVKQHTENVHVFSFTNTGTQPLLIENAQGSCGCTVPEFPKEPIPPGGSGEIKVKYSPGSQIGAQTKTVAITSNVEPRVQNLFIYADVEGVPDPVLE